MTAGALIFCLFFILAAATEKTQVTTGTNGFNSTQIVAHVKTAYSELEQVVEDEKRGLPEAVVAQARAAVEQAEVQKGIAALAEGDPKRAEKPLKQAVTDDEVAKGDAEEMQQKSVKEEAEVNKAMEALVEATRDAKADEVALHKAIVAKGAAEGLAATATERAAQAEAKLKKIMAGIPGTEDKLAKENTFLRKQNKQANLLKVLLSAFLFFTCCASIALYAMVYRLKSQHAYHLLSMMKLNADRVMCMEKIHDLTTPILNNPQEPVPQDAHEPTPPPPPAAAPQERARAPEPERPEPKPVPAQDNRLIDWYKEAQRLHVQPLITESQAHKASVNAAPIVEHPMRYVYIKRVPIPVYESHHLQTMPVHILRMHADHLYRTIGPAAITVPVPARDEDIGEWIMQAQNAHVQTLQGQSSSLAVPHVYIRGTPMPLYHIEHLQSMPLSQLRVHANHLFNTISGINRPVPEKDNLLLRWVVEMHERHLDQHFAQLGRAPVAAYTVPHSVPHVHYKGASIPLYEPQHLRTMSPVTLRAHADYMYRLVGPALLEPVPQSDHELADWITAVHEVHLKAIRHQAVPHSAPTVYLRGTPLPLYERHHLEALPHAQLRVLSQHLYDTITPVKVARF
jgi:hypothetical protein